MCCGSLAFWLPCIRRIDTGIPENRGHRTARFKLASTYGGIIFAPYATNAYSYEVFFSKENSNESCCGLGESRVVLGFDVHDAAAFSGLKCP